MPITLNLTYDQMLSMIMQLSYDERMQMSRDIIKKSRLDAFHKIMISNRPAELDDDTVLAECKAARQEIYERSLSKL